MKSKIKRLKLKIVPNAPEYHDFIRKLRNHPQIKKGFIKQSHINIKDQESYMKKYGKNYFICLFNNIPAGYVGVIDEDVRVAVHPNFQNQGIGVYMIKHIMKKHKKLQAKIKINNNPSINLFKKAGFKIKYYLYSYENKQQSK